MAAFSVGDTVRVHCVSQAHGGNENYVGQTATVVSVGDCYKQTAGSSHSLTTCYQIEFTSDHMRWMIGEIGLTLVEPEAKGHIMPGDVVRNGGSPDYNADQPYMVKTLWMDGSCGEVGHALEHVHYYNGGWDYCHSLILVKKGDGSAAGPGTTHKPNEETVPMSAIQTIRAAKLTTEDRVLRGGTGSEYELESADGIVTSYGVGLMNQKMWEANRSAYAKELLAAKKTLANEIKAYGDATTADKDDE
jgi:hypothetical protein